MSHLETPIRTPETSRGGTSAARAQMRPEIDVMAKALAAAVRSVSRADQRPVLDRSRGT